MFLSAADIDKLVQLPGGEQLKEIYVRLLAIQDHITRDATVDEATDLAREACKLAKDAVAIVEEHL
jgi:hypothetical protein